MCSLCTAHGRPAVVFPHIQGVISYLYLPQWDGTSGCTMPLGWPACVHQSYYSVLTVHVGNNYDPSAHVFKHGEQLLHSRLLQQVQKEAWGTLLQVSTSWWFRRSSSINPFHTTIEAQSTSIHLLHGMRHMYHIHMMMRCTTNVRDMYMYVTHLRWFTWNFWISSIQFGLSFLLWPCP